MTAGELRHRVHIEQPVRAEHPDTGEIVVTWATVATVWASVLARRSDEREEAKQIVAQTAYDVRIRHRTGITSDHRLTWDGKTLKLIGEPIDPDGKRSELRIQAVEVS